MMAKQKRALQSVLVRSSRLLKLSWLLLLTCTGLVIHCYFQYLSLASSCSAAVVHHEKARGVSPSLRFGSHNRKLSNPVTDILVSSSAADDRNAATARDNKNEEGTENEESLESESESFQGSNEPDTGVTYDASTGEFGVVFADRENGGTAGGEAEEEEETVGGEEGERAEEEQETLSESQELGSYSLENEYSQTEEHIVSEDEANERKDEKLYYNHSKSANNGIYYYRENLTDYILKKPNNSDPHCLVPSLFQSWRNGMVTQMGPPLKRDCRKLRQNPAQEMKKSKLSSQLKVWKSGNPWETFALRFKQMSCADIRQEFENNFYVSEMEKEFPIAYIFVVYTNAGQVLRLLKSIYRPHNLYCIHPDARQGEGFKEFFATVAKCLDNVFVVSKPVRVYYGHISITDAQLHCMRDLVSYPETRWRYVINLCGREIPIKTNREIVESLQKLQGHTALNLHPLTKSYWGKRFRYKFHLRENGTMGLTEEKQAKPPKEITLHKSMNFLAASRAFVHFLLHDPLSIEFHEYLATVYAPEEHFYSSLYALPRANGAQPPRGSLDLSEMPIVDNFIWLSTKHQKHHVSEFCPGKKVVHCICILTAADMARIEAVGVNSRQPVFFFNKYFLEWDPIPMDCMEERLVQANMDEYRRDCLPTHRHTEG